MSVEAHRENLDKLRRRVMDESGLGLPQPYVSTEIARLLTELVTELTATVMELELTKLINEDLQGRLRVGA